jgi:alanine racemase
MTITRDPSDTVSPIQHHTLPASFFQELEKKGLYTSLIIHLDRVLRNYEFLKLLSPEKCGAVVKANAYGLGSIPISQALYQSGCRHFFGAFLDEGIQIREALPPDAIIFVLQGCLSGWETELYHHQLIPLLCSGEQVETWNQWSRILGTAIPYGLFFDTQMHRSGISKSEWDLDQFPLNPASMQLIASHLACASQPLNPFNQLQREEFEKIRTQFPRVPASFANSSGLFLGSQYGYQLTRPGMALYGLNPTPWQENPMDFSVTLLSRILQISTVSSSETIGYDRSHQLQRTSRIATVMCGYGDGIPWLLCKSSLPQNLLLGAHLVPIIGRISMDLITVDVTDVPESVLETNRWVQVLGSFNQNDWSQGCQTASYETFARLGSRVRRVYL